MAKKTTKDELESLLQDWAGDGSSDGYGRLNPYNKTSDGLPFSGLQIQKFIKSNLSDLQNKAGYWCISNTTDSNAFYHLWGYASKEAYDDDSEANRLYDVVIPISTVLGDSYAAYLYTSLNNKANIVVAEGKLEVPLRFCAVQISNGERLNYGSKGTLQIERSTNGGELWTKVATLSNVLVSSAYGSDEYKTIDLGSYLTNGTQEIRVRASFQYEDTEGTLRTATSAYMTLGATITRTSLSIVNKQSYQTPILQSVYGTQFPLSYIVNGATSKTLHIEVTGSKLNYSGTFELTANDDNSVVSQNISDAKGVYGLLTHGTHKVTAWLTCDDGLGNTLTSDVVTNTFMVVNEEASTDERLKPYLLLQNMIDSATNFVQTSLCEYAVYSPKLNDDGAITNDGDAVDLVFYLTSYNRNFPEGSYTEYFRMEEKCSPNTQNTLNTTVEVESDDASFNTYFRVWSEKNGKAYNILQQSTGEADKVVAIDNTDSFAPTSGATFMLNPKVRNNSEENPERILNARDNNKEVASTWKGFDHVSDGWITSSVDGMKVLRVPAGSKLNIQYNPFAQFISNPNSAMTIEFDLAVRNVTNETDPIISICETVEATGTLLGLRILPMKGNIFSASNTIDFETDFQWEEDKRTHISVNINNLILPNKGDALAPKADSGLTSNATEIALVRVFVDGNIYREVKFNASNRNEFCTGVMSNGGITIGQEGADVDIYSIRCYENRALEVDDIMRNQISTLPSSGEKKAKRVENDLLVGGLISLDRCRANGKRCLIWHGAEPYKYASDGQKGWWEIHQYDNAGNYLPEFSGTIGKESKSITATRQGSTANTYYYSNLQTKIDKLRKIIVPLSSFHSSIVVSAPRNQVDDAGSKVVDANGKEVLVCDVTGGNLGKNFPLQNKTAEYVYSMHNNVPSLEVPDGWIDGNGKYRGPGYIVAEGTPMAQKLVNKINYASSMQSHLCGVTRLFSDLHTAVVGKNGMQNINDTCRVAKYTEPFLFFTQADGATQAYYRGACTFGAGKMDKPTWGYVKKLQPMFMMIEGSDNNYDLTDFRVPFHEDSQDPVSYNPKEEGWFYNGLQCLDFDAGATDEDGDGNKYPKASIVARLKETVNFLYLHSPMLMYYSGTFENFLLSKEAENTTKKYWCTEGSEQYKLKRYDYTNRRWVDAGLWDSANRVYGSIDLRTYSMTKAVYDASTNKAKFAELNNELIGAIVVDFKKYAPWYFNVKSMQLHYCFINHFVSGTDNCSKNTYYVCNPYAVNVTIDGVTKECYLWEMHQDDVDTVLPTDNNGRNTKPYYIDRMHPYADTDERQTNCLYEGMNNVLFNLIELAYEDSRELQSMMKTIFTAMCGLVSESDVIPGYTGSSKVSVWGCLSKYLFAVQNYIPDICFNEQARIRYEAPEMWNYTSRGSGARNIHPITQSVGSSLHSEMQYMRRRLIYMASYAGWGEFSSAKDNSTGISDAVDSFSMQVYHLPDSNTSASEYKFDVVPHQYIYPTGMMGQTAIDPHVRVAPGEAYQLNLGTTLSNDTGMSIMCANYYRSYGNVGDLSCKPELTLTVNGKRLTRFVANPTKLYKDMDTGEMVPAFRPANIAVSATRLKDFSLKGCSQIGGTLNISNCIRLHSMNIEQTSIYDVQFPESQALHKAKLPTKITNLTLRNQQGLTELSMEGYASLSYIYIDCAKVDFDVLSLVQRIYEANPSKLNSVTLLNIAWDGAENQIAPAMIAWLCKKGAVLTGSINCSTASGTFAFEQKLALAKRYGDIDSQSNSLYVKYREINIAQAVIAGKKYIDASICTKSSDGSYTYNGLSLTAQPSTGNNVQLVDGEVDVTWSIPSNPYATISNVRTGELRITAFSAEDIKFEVKAVLNKTDGTQLEATFIIGFYKRTPKLGDFAYLDGTFDDSYDKTKDLGGIVFARLWYQHNPDEALPEGISNPILAYESIDGGYKVDPKAKYMKLYIVSKENLLQKSTDENATPINTRMTWGLRADSSSGDDGFSATEMQEILDLINERTGSALSSMFDLAGLQNVTKYGLYTKSGSSTDRAFADIIQADMDNETDYKNGGFRWCHTPQGAEAYTAMALWNGKANTQKIVNWVNTIINTFISEHYEAMNPPTNLQELADYMYEVLYKRVGDGAKNKYYQFAYPAAYACFLYEPKANFGEVAEQYKRGQWFLPSAGELTRLYHHYNISRYKPITTTDANNSGYVPNSDYASYDVEQGREGIDAWNPIFAKMYKRIKDAGGSALAFTNIETSALWSSSEANSQGAHTVYFAGSHIAFTYKHVEVLVRPVVTYIFKL